MHLLAGGYKSFRQEVRVELESSQDSYSFTSWQAQLAQVRPRSCRNSKPLGTRAWTLKAREASRLDTRRIARDSQPHQKQFESLIHHKLRSFTPDKPVWVEAESHRVGAVHIPDHLFKVMRCAPIIRLDVPRSERVEHLIANYNSWVDSQTFLVEKLRYLTRLRSKATVESWIDLVNARNWSQLTSELLEFHYDPTYHNARSLREVANR